MSIDQSRKSKRKRQNSEKNQISRDCIDQQFQQKENKENQPIIQNGLILLYNLILSFNKKNANKNQQIEPKLQQEQKSFPIPPVLCLEKQEQQETPVLQEETSLSPLLSQQSQCIQIQKEPEQILTQGQEISVPINKRSNFFDLDKKFFFIILKYLWYSEILVFATSCSKTYGFWQNILFTENNYEINLKIPTFLSHFEQYRKLILGNRRKKIKFIIRRVDFIFIPEKSQESQQQSIQFILTVIQKGLCNNIPVMGLSGDIMDFLFFFQNYEKRQKYLKSNKKQDFIMSTFSFIYIPSRQKNKFLFPHSLQSIQTEMYSTYWDLQLNIKNLIIKNIPFSLENTFHLFLMRTCPMIETLQINNKVKWIKNELMNMNKKIAKKKR